MYVQSLLVLSRYTLYLSLVSAALRREVKGDPPISELKLGGKKKKDMATAHSTVKTHDDIIQ